jgi:hypothetical protein
MTRRPIWILTAFMLAASAAGAQSNSAMAESLFRDGKKLLEERRFDEACPKFKESSRLDPSSGVELALGLCYEGQGKTASAWGAYVTAASLARRDGRHDRELAATTHAEALEPKLFHLTIQIAAETVAVGGLTVKQDGVDVGSETWKGAPADPGVHTIEVTAPGKKPFTTTIEVGQGPQSTVRIPALEDAPLPPAITPNGVVVLPPPPPPPAHTGRTLGYVTGGGGAAALVAGTILGLVTLHDASSAHTTCPTSPCSNAQGVSENNSAGTTADWSTGLFVAGAAAVVVGVTLVLLDRSSSDSRPTTGARVTPVLAPGYAGLSGRF